MKTILLIEDNLEMRENTAEILELAGYTVHTAENGKVGVRMAQEHDVDLIICDVMMPELDGYGVIHMLSRNSRTASIPFIFLTAKAEKADFRKGMNLGADDYLTKPFEELELLDAIELRLKKNSQPKQPVEATQAGVSAFLNESAAKAALEELKGDRETRIYQEKDLLFKESSHPRYLFFIISGKVKTYMTHEYGKEYITSLYKAGDFLGFVSILEDKPYIESAMAMEDTEVMLIPTEDFLKLVYNDRNVSHQFIKLLSQNVIEKENQLLHLAYDSVRKRVANALLYLQDRFHSDNEQFSMPISRENLASIVGTSKECVIRVLSSFKSDGLVNTDKSEITILAPEQLQKIIG